MTSKELTKNRSDCAVEKAHERVASPRVNVIEKEDGYCIEAEMPGVSEKDVEVELKHRRLWLAGSRDAGKCNIRYERAFHLPDGIDGDKVEAKMAHGILHLVIPRSEATRPRTIKVKAG